MYEIESERALLRVPVRDDLDRLAAIFANPEVMKFMDLDCQPLSREKTGQIIDNVILNWEKNGFGRWTVINKQTNDIIGLAGFRKYEDLAELFYVLDESQWGKGMATEIAKVIVETGFDRHRFRRIIALTRPQNTASRRVLNKIGMTFEGESEMFGVWVVNYFMDLDDFHPGA